MSLREERTIYGDLASFSAKIAPEADWSDVDNTVCRSLFVENFQKSHDEGQYILCAVRYASNALPVRKWRSSYLWIYKPELDYARMQVQGCTDKFVDSSRQHTDAITNMEALHASAAAKAASGIIDEIGLHKEQCIPAATWRAINSVTGRKCKPVICLGAASIDDR